MYSLRTKLRLAFSTPRSPPSPKNAPPQTRDGAPVDTLMVDPSQDRERTLNGLSSFVHLQPGWGRTRRNGSKREPVRSPIMSFFEDHMRPFGEASISLIVAGPDPHHLDCFIPLPSSICCMRGACTPLTWHHVSMRSCIHDKCHPLGVMEGRTYEVRTYQVLNSILQAGGVSYIIE